MSLLPSLEILYKYNFSSPFPSRRSNPDLIRAREEEGKGELSSISSDRLVFTVNRRIYQTALEEGSNVTSLFFKTLLYFIDFDSDEKE